MAVGAVGFGWDLGEVSCGAAAGVRAMGSTVIADGGDLRRGGDDAARREGDFAGGWGGVGGAGFVHGGC